MNNNLNLKRGGLEAGARLRHYDVVVIGAGLGGFCAALSAARHGAKTALVNDRPMIGGNGSSEIQMCICGADAHGTRSNARETGIVEEYLLRNRLRNPYQSYSISDTIFWEMAKEQPNLDLYLNTRATDASVRDGKIGSVRAVQMTTEKTFDFQAHIFVDATGDGYLAARAGAKYMFGREAKSEFGEPDAPDEHDTYVMGVTLLFKARRMDKPVPFVRPEWAHAYTEYDLRKRGHYNGSNIWQSKYSLDAGYWWIELGGGELDVIGDAEDIRDELLKVLYGVWDHIKNGGDHGAQNYALDWVQMLPGKRESRRITGDFILTENDLLHPRLFEDRVAYGGWPMDMHCIRGIRNPDEEPTHYIHVPELYSIPYRCYCSNSIDNLMMAGRCISATHMAHGSTRIMATCAVGGQAVGTAAAIAVREGIAPREVAVHMSELQQTLLRDDCYLIDVRNEDPDDRARLGKASSDVSLEGYEPRNLLNGIARGTAQGSNCWNTGKLDAPKSIAVRLDRPSNIREVICRFDTQLGREISMFIFTAHLADQVAGVPPELVRDFGLRFWREGHCVHEERIRDNIKRNATVRLPRGVMCDEIELTVYATYGAPDANVFELRAYE